ncbi:MAG TPA: DUF1990 domain-containing protein [Acidobacteriaceae bacterium]|nr:DUF1990 domain-containing protein [Acidobacteriaceae bacterium]
MTDNRAVPSRELSYDPVGATDPASAAWQPGRHRFQATVVVGRGEECWTASREAVLAWAVKVRSGFLVTGGPQTVRPGQDYELTFRIGPIAIREPVRVVAVMDEPDRCGFAYGTRPGHPVAGEEAFIVHRDGRGVVRLTLRSLTMPASGWRALAFPVFVVAQRAFRHRYLRALNS